MAESFRAPIGTQDVLPPASARWQALIATFAGVAERFGFGLIHGPLFEDLGVFQRLGAGTEVVRKEMYDFQDKGDRHLALRPEATASVARAFVQHRPPTPWKVWCVTPAFRYERPQAGRLRQHHQVDVEVVGVADPDVDVEIIALGATYLNALGLRRWRLAVNTMGTPADRAAFATVVQAWLRDRVADLAPEDREKVDSHPLRVLDSKREETQAVVAGAPRMAEVLDAASLGHFERVQRGLSALGIPFSIEPSLVRGLDYYTHTLFEFQSEALDAAQSTVIGGGRYDGLIEQLGGPPTPGIGFGAGIERLLQALEHEGITAEPRALELFFLIEPDADRAAALAELAKLRAAGVSCDADYAGRSLKGQRTQLARSGARGFVHVRADGATIKRGDVEQDVSVDEVAVTVLG
jgi:histidyl-tRNA synthetase